MWSPRRRALWRNSCVRRESGDSGAAQWGEDRIWCTHERPAVEGPLPRVSLCHGDALQRALQFSCLLCGRQEVRVFQDQSTGTVAFQHTSYLRPVHRVDRRSGSKAGPIPGALPLDHHRQCVRLSCGLSNGAGRMVLSKSVSLVEQGRTERNSQVGLMAGRLVRYASGIRGHGNSNSLALHHTGTRLARSPVLPDSTTVARLPGYRLWLCDTEFCGSIGFRWQPGTSQLPPPTARRTVFAFESRCRPRCGKFSNGFAAADMALVEGDAHD